MFNKFVLLCLFAALQLDGAEAQQGNAAGTLFGQAIGYGILFVISIVAGYYAVCRNQFKKNFLTPINDEIDKARQQVLDANQIATTTRPPTSGKYMLRLSAAVSEWMPTGRKTTVFNLRFAEDQENKNCWIIDGSDPKTSTQCVGLFCNGKYYFSYLHRPVYGSLMFCCTGSFSRNKFSGTWHAPRGETGTADTLNWPHKKRAVPRTSIETTMQDIETGGGPTEITTRESETSEYFESDEE